MDNFLEKIALRLNTISILLALLLAMIFFLFPSHDIDVCKRKKIVKTDTAIAITGTEKMKIITTYEAYCE